jgi:hypothetical protein
MYVRMRYRWKAAQNRVFSIFSIFIIFSILNIFLRTQSEYIITHSRVCTIGDAKISGAND